MSLITRKKFLIFVAAFLIGAPVVVFALNTIATGFQVASTQVTIDAHGVCKKVNATDGKSYFVPTNTAGEWSAFRANKPSGVSLGSCGGSIDYTVPGTYTFTVPLGGRLAIGDI